MAWAGSATSKMELFWYRKNPSTPLLIPLTSNYSGRIRLGAPLYLTIKHPKKLQI